MVVGYQGGERNQIGGYFEVKYSDAHAWSEVYIDQQWRRVDPTAAVSPERVEFGMDALLESWDGQQLFSNGSGRALADYLNPTGFNKLNQSRINRLSSMLALTEFTCQLSHGVIATSQQAYGCPVRLPSCFGRNFLRRGQIAH